MLCEDYTTNLLDMEHLEVMFLEKVNSQSKFHSGI